MRFAKPISYNILLHLAGDGRPVLIIEEGVSNGGIAEYLANEILIKNNKKKLDCITIPEEFPSVGTRKELLNQYQFTSGEIVKRIGKLLR